DHQCALHLSPFLLRWRPARTAADRRQPQAGAPISLLWSKFRGFWCLRKNPSIQHLAAARDSPHLSSFGGLPMPHDTPLISTIVGGLVLAFIFGAIANRFRMPPLIGYLIAGVLVGPFTPGFVADAELATELSEIGVILLMFGVGLHFSLKDLLSVRAIAIPGAAVQIGGGTLMGLGLALLLGWSVGAGLIFGLALSVASTVVLLKALQDRRIVDSEKGRI